MRTSMLVFAAALAAATATPAAAQTITGSLAFGTPANGNFFNPSTATIGNGVEFTYQDAANLDTADFTGTSLTIKDVTSPNSNAAQFFMSFTSNVAGFFDNAAFSNNGFGGSFVVNGNTLTFTAPQFNTSGTRTSVITFAGAAGAVPEPATWAMMVIGFGAVGGALRRRSKVATSVRYA